MTSAGLPEAVIKVRLPEDLPAVLVDAAQLERVVSNLLTNAVRYGSNGSPVVVTADRAGERVHLRIRDQGSGIATQDLTRIFEPFYRGGDAHGHGSGLGLAIAKGFVEGNGGRLWAQSEPDEGSTFTVDLPVAL
jgi:two-component system, OmpR family, sensor histidine kinase KdpD